MWYSDSRVLRIPRLSLKSQLFLYCVGVPIAAWEIGVLQRKQFNRQLRDEVDTSYPFYGKKWGFQTDYDIECSLKTGDLLFWNYEIGSLHAWEALLTKILNTVWDRVGILEQTDQGAVVHFGRERLSYRNIVADYRTSNVGIRRLQTSGDVRNSIRQSLSRIEEEVDLTVTDRLASWKHCYLRKLADIFSVATTANRHDARFVGLVYEEAALISADLRNKIGISGIEHVSCVQLTENGALDRFFFPRNGGSTFMHHKKTGYLGSLSYKRLNEGKSGSAAF